MALLLRLRAKLLEGETPVWRPALSRCVPLVSTGQNHCAEVLAESGEGEGCGIDDGRVAGDQVRGEPARAGTDAEAVAGKA